jgi:glycosyltransferase involved in cell wall biosynthesis
MDVSIIIPVERLGGDAERAIASVLVQKTELEYELIVVSSTAVPPGGGPPEVRNVVVEDRNPAARRNRGAAAAKGGILGFMDDDATAAPDWLDRAVACLNQHPQALAVGGPDSAPDGSPPSELLSETLLATPLIGSGVACHENRRGTFPVSRPTDVALVNLFVRRSAFEAGGGFDERVGYIGEDTRLIASLMERGDVLYSSAVRVAHRRRRFPSAYLRQRWRYRLKTGELLARGDPSYRNPMIYALLLAGFGFLIAAVAAPLVAAMLLAFYLVATFALAVPRTRLPGAWWPLIPPAFLLHHATYFGGICFGIVRGLWRGRLDAAPGGPPQ